MVSSEYRQQYQARYGTGTVTDPSPGDSIIKDNFGVDGQITTIRVFADNPVSLTITSASIDTGEEPTPFNGKGNPQLSSVGNTGNALPKLELRGSSSYVVGDFENPAVEVGSYSQINVKVAESMSGTDKDVAVNIRTDERTG